MDENLMVQMNVKKGLPGFIGTAGREMTLFLNFGLLRLCKSG
jgi:hypothetical protein